MPEYKAVIKDYTLREIRLAAPDNASAWEAARNSEPDDWEDSENTGFEVVSCDRVDPQPGSNPLPRYRALHDGLSNMVEEGRLKQRDIPDDYHWLVESLAELAGMDPT